MARRIHATRLALVGALGLLLPGCVVHADRLEAAQNATRVERQAHQATAHQLFEAKRSLAASQQERKAQESAADSSKDESEQQVAQLQLDHDLVAHDRDTTAQLVDQLRGELARVGGHLEVFGEQKKDLARQLADAERRAQNLRLRELESARKVVLVRDVTLIVAPLLRSGRGSVAFDAGKLVLYVDSSEVFGADGKELPLTKAASGWLQALGKVTASPQPRARIEVSEVAAGPSDDQQLLRLAKVAEVLTQSGLPSEHVTVSIPEPGRTSGSAPRVQLRFTLPPPTP